MTDNDVRTKLLRIMQCEICELYKISVLFIYSQKRRINTAHEKNVSV